MEAGVSVLASWHVASRPLITPSPGKQIASIPVPSDDMEASTAYTVRTVSRRMVRPTYGAIPMPSSEEDIQLTPWDLYCLSIKYIQKGILLPRPPAGGEINLVDTLASSLSRALGRYYHFAGRLAVEQHGEGTVTIPLRPTGEGAELVHAVAAGVAVADVVGSVVQAFLPLNGVCNADAAIDSSLPVLCAQVTELDDGFFIGMSMNHTVGDGACFWDFLNAWSAINRGDEEHMRAPAPVHRRWFVDTMPRADARGPAGATGTGLLHLLRRNLPGPRPPAWAGDVLLPAHWVPGAHACHPGGLRGKRHHAQHDKELHRRRDPRQGAGLDRWAREPSFSSPASSRSGCALLITSSPRFDVYGNDFGWGKPVGLCSGPKDNTDGKVSVFEGPEREGSMSLEVSLLPEAMERLAADHEFMEAVAIPRA
ncbi:hypothetical protein ACQ4PT_051044 [Festuca glaucescens]